MAAVHLHPYAVQDAALVLALIPSAALIVIASGARFFDRARRARKPAFVIS